MKQRLSVFVPSRLFIYYNERVIERTVRMDSGAQLRDGIKSVASDGACPEPEWPYVIAKFASRPSVRAYRDARLDRAISYQSLVQDLNQMKGCLASGYPFVFGFTVYQSFETRTVAKSGHAPMPMWGERPIGGATGVAVGLDHSHAEVFSRKSCGEGRGPDAHL